MQHIAGDVPNTRFMVGMRTSAYAVPSTVQPLSTEKTDSLNYPREKKKKKRIH